MPLKASVEVERAVRKPRALLVVLHDSEALGNRSGFSDEARGVNRVNPRRNEDNRRLGCGPRNGVSVGRSISFREVANRRWALHM